MITKKEVIEQTINHWQKMIRWAKKQKSREMAYNYRMWSGLKEDWNAAYSSLCQKYQGLTGLCPSCPLNKKYGGCVIPKSGENNLWRRVNNSRTWGDWVRNAEKFLVQLKSLLPRPNTRRNND